MVIYRHGRWAVHLDSVLAIEMWGPVLAKAKKPLHITFILVGGQKFTVDVPDEQVYEDLMTAWEAQQAEIARIKSDPEID